MGYDRFNYVKKKKVKMTDKEKIAEANADYRAEKAKYIEIKNHLFEEIAKPKILALKGEDKQIWKVDISSYFSTKTDLELYAELGAPEYSNREGLYIFFTKYPNAVVTFKGIQYKSFQEVLDNVNLSNYDFDFLTSRGHLYGMFIFEILFAIKKDLYEGKPIDKLKVLDFLLVRGIDRDFLHTYGWGKIFSLRSKGKTWIELNQHILDKAELDDISERIDAIALSDKPTPKRLAVRKDEDYSKLTKPLIIAKIKELDPNQKNLPAKRKDDLIALLKTLM